jgi:hypothetical protein
MHAEMLHCAWSPSQKRRSLPPGGTSGWADFADNSTDIDSDADPIVQRNIAWLQTRAARLDCNADLLLSIGQHAAAERLAHRALELREVIA